MTDIVGALWTAQNDADALGRVLRGLGALAAHSDQLWLIVEGHAPRRVATKDIGLTLNCITIAGQTLAALVDIRGMDRSSGEPCVSFEIAGKEAMFAPAEPPADDQFVIEAGRFLDSDWCEDDIVYLSSLDGPLGDRSRSEKLDQLGIMVMRHMDNAPGGPIIGNDILRVLGEDMRLADMTWFERETDGDGNRYAHIVMKDGRYRRISLGDLGR